MYVDNLLLAVPVGKELLIIAHEISKPVEVRIDKHVSKFLGVILQSDTNSNAIKVHDAPTIEGALRGGRFGMDDSSPAKTALLNGIVLIKLHNESNEKLPYRKLIRVLRHHSNTVRPDITYSVIYFLDT